MRLPQFDGVLGKVVVRRPSVELWHNGTLVWWNAIEESSIADRIEQASDYCLRWTGSLPDICFES